jgi:opacity protein-like surface antigen
MDSTTFTLDRSSPASSPRRAALAAVALLACAITSLVAPGDAHALDGYEDRRGIFAGFGAGGGIGRVVVDPDDQRTGLDDGRKLGLHLDAIIGGGVHERITVGFETAWWIRTVRLNENSLNHHHLSFNALADFYVADFFFIEGGVGLAYTIFDAERSGTQTLRYQEMGLAAKLGAGLEFFLTGNIAANFSVDYTRHFYGNANFDTFNAGIGLKWY